MTKKILFVSAAILLASVSSANAGSSWHFGIYTPAPVYYAPPPPPPPQPVYVVNSYPYYGYSYYYPSYQYNRWDWHDRHEWREHHRDRGRHRGWDDDDRW